MSIFYNSTVKQLASLTFIILFPVNFPTEGILQDKQKLLPRASIIS